MAIATDIKRLIADLPVAEALKRARQPVGHIGVYTLRFEPLALRVYTPMWPTSFHHYSNSHYLFLLRGSKVVGRVPEFHV